MNTQRQSLSHPDLAHRIRRFDHSSSHISARPHPLNNPRPRTTHLETSLSLRQKPTSERLYHNEGKLEVQNQVASSASQRLITHSQTSNLGAMSRRFQQTNEQVSASSQTIKKQFEGLKLSQPPKKVKRQKVLSGALNSFALVAFTVAGFFGLQMYQLSTSVDTDGGTYGVVAASTSDDQGIAFGTSEKPSSAAVDDTALLNYHVSPELPRYLRIASLGVFTRVKHIDTHHVSEMLGPGNINDVGWLASSSKPGAENGDSIITGHIRDGGAFSQLNQLSSGDTFVVEKGNGKTIKYEVLAVDSVATIPATSNSAATDMKLIGIAEHSTKAEPTYTAVSAKQISQ